ncbi:hypothetical protein [Azospirillum sp. TSO22-1]|uniref:hypothetical protein n=1 Tax=Azospirillum sp. TSO22-1 TaxID=716789 RepID=UPI001304D4F7|nr:hypothetical protein [Azospirillum sp. TSO22-1]
MRAGRSLNTMTRVASIAALGMKTLLKVMAELGGETLFLLALVLGVLLVMGHS